MEKASEFSFKKLPDNKTGEITSEEIIRMSPNELMNLFSDLQEKEKLEEFLEKSAENESLLALFSLWEKWLLIDQRKMVDEIVGKKKEIYGESGESLPLELEKKFNREELILIFKNIGAIQLTFGCSKGCPFCAFDAVPGVREHIPYSQLVNLFQQYGLFLKETKPYLYYASEPSDYASKEGLKDKTYQDVHQLAEEYAGYNPHITSRNINDKDWLEYLGLKENARISLFGLSKEEILEIKQTLKTKINSSGKEKTIVDSTGEEQTHTRGIGVSHKEYPLEWKWKTGIGNFNGLLITPRGIYNMMQRPVSEKFPQGQVLIPLGGISGEKIKLGESLHSLLSSSIIKYQSQPMFSYEDKRKSLTILRSDGIYEILIDESDIIVSCARIADLNYETKKTEKIRWSQRGFLEKNK